VPSHRDQLPSGSARRGQAFRKNLFYRLNGLAVRLPPLGERSDLLALVRRILNQPTEHDRQQRHRQPNADLMHLFQHAPGRAIGAS